MPEVRRVQDLDFSVHDFCRKLWQDHTSISIRFAFEVPGRCFLQFWQITISPAFGLSLWIIFATLIAIPTKGFCLYSQAYSPQWTQIWNHFFIFALRLALSVGTRGNSGSAAVRRFRFRHCELCSRPLLSPAPPASACIPKRTVRNRRTFGRIALP